tara:strand:+ start:342 stop:644 length:303 start_codon:yes stop_codon:yes gene_type:complete
MPKFKPNKGFRMTSPLKDKTRFIDKVKSAGKAAVAGLYAESGSRRTNVFSTVSDAYKESKSEYRDIQSKKKKKKSATPKKSFYKAGQTAGQIVRRERHMV